MRPAGTRGAQRPVGEERFPAAGRAFVEAVCRMLSDALRDIDCKVVRIDAVQFGK